MAHVSTAAAHLPVEEIEVRIKHEREAWRIRRWLVIPHALGTPTLPLSLRSMEGSPRKLCATCCGHRTGRALQGSTQWGRANANRRTSAWPRNRQLSRSFSSRVQ